jgi:hypothetical protein
MYQTPTCATGHSFSILHCPTRHTSRAPSGRDLFGSHEIKTGVLQTHSIKGKVYSRKGHEDPEGE